MSDINKLNNLNKISLIFYQEGYVKIKNLFNIKKLNKIRKDTIKLNKKNKSQLIQIHKYNKSVYRLFYNKNLKYNLLNILGYKKISGLQSERFYNPPGTSGFPPHQDDFFIGSGKYNSVNLWIPLQNVKRGNGCLYFFAKSHKEKINKKLNLNSLNNKSFNFKNQKKYKKKYVPCNIGDAILISNHVIHGSIKNSSQSKREVLVLGFIQTGSKFNAGQTAKRRPFQV